MPNRADREALKKRIEAAKKPSAYEIAKKSISPVELAKLNIQGGINYQNDLAEAVRKKAITRMQIEFEPDRDVVFFLFTKSERVWFVNNSDETLAEVTGSDGGFTTADDDVIARGYKENIYQYVEPGEAVSIAQAPDGFYDLDYVISYYVTIVSSAYGRMEFSTEPAKGGKPDSTLLKKRRRK